MSTKKAKGNKSASAVASQPGDDVVGSQNAMVAGLDPEAAAHHDFGLTSNSMFALGGPHTNGANDHGHPGLIDDQVASEAAAAAAAAAAVAATNAGGSSNVTGTKRDREDDDGDGDSDEDGKAEKRSGRRKINIEFIEDKSRRHITFSKRKLGIMKKAYELSTLTGTQVLLLVASETGHVYTFATPKLQPLITKPEGKNLIQTCLNAPDPIPSALATQQQQPQPSYEPVPESLPDYGAEDPNKKLSNNPHYAAPLASYPQYHNQPSNMNMPNSYPVSYAGYQNAPLPQYPNYPSQQYWNGLPPAGNVAINPQQQQQQPKSNYIMPSDKK